MKYFVRLRKPFAEVETVLRSIADKSNALVVYEHNERQDNIHIHFYIDTVLKSDALKVRLKKAYPFQAQEWAFTTAYDDNCIVYMSKGKLEPSFVKGYTETQLNDFRARWEVREAPQQQKQKTGPTQYQMAKEVRDMTPEVESVISLYQQLIANSITVHLKHEKAFSEFNLEKIATTAFAMYHRGRVSLVERLVAKFSKYGV